MWPITQKRVFGACCAAVVCHRKLDGLDIALVSHSALEEDDGEPGGSLIP
jgi:hypothetical protein